MSEEEAVQRAAAELRRRPLTAPELAEAVGLSARDGPRLLALVRAAGVELHESRSPLGVTFRVPRASSGRG